MKKEMLINVLQPEEIRIAIIEDGVLEELYVERTSHESYVGNIYKGRIVNIEPSIQAAFVDFGVGRNGFLHVSDVEPAYYQHLDEQPAYRRDDRGGRRGGRSDRGERGERGDRNDRGDRGGRAPQARGDRDEPARRGRDEPARGGRDEPGRRGRFVEPPAEANVPAVAEEPVVVPGEFHDDALPTLHIQSEMSHYAPPSPPTVASASTPSFGAGIFDDNEPTWAPVTERPISAFTPPPAEPPATRHEAPIVAEAEPEQAIPKQNVDDAPAAPGTEAIAESEPPAKGRRRPARGKTPRKPRGEKAKKEAAKQEPEAALDAELRPDAERPRLMESSERRTDENDPPTRPLEPRPAADLSDEDLSFSMLRGDEPRMEPHTPVPAWEPELHAPALEPELDEPPPFEPRHEERPHGRPARFEPRRFEPAPEEDEPAWKHAKVDEAEELDAPEPADEPDADAEDDDEPAGGTSVIDFDEDYGPEFEEFETQREQRRPTGAGGAARGGPGHDDRRGGPRGRGRRPMGRPGAGRPKPPIQEIFKRGQEVLVQVIKEGIGTKGPTLSTYISIAGRYLVLMPGLNRVGVSRKIEDDETRRRLREIMNELHPPKGLGFIIRTAGQDRNKKELQRDLAYLSRLWQVVARRIRQMKSPAEIYQESDMVTRTIRDIFTGDIDTIWVDEASAFEAAKEFLTIVMPRYASRIKHWDSSEPMFYKHGIEQEITRIQQRHVPLAHGGSIVIDQTEALVAIDVNSGNFRADNNAEETAYQMNLQAAKEIARQLRLRDLGGVIVNDFIDMRDEKHRRNVERALRDAMLRDRARTKILRISQFGIIEMTRQRIRPSLKRSVYQDCQHCRGTGQVKTVESMSIEVMRLLQLAVHRMNVMRIELQVHDSVAQYLLNRKRKDIVQLEEQSTKPIAVRSAGTSVAPEHLEFLCYDNNNNEVKFIPFEEPRLPVRRRMH